MTTIYLLFLVNVSDEIIPSCVNKKIITGNWKAIPKAKINFKTNDKYSLTLGSKSIFKP